MLCWRIQQRPRVPSEFAVIMSSCWISFLHGGIPGIVALAAAIALAGCASPTSEQEALPSASATMTRTTTTVAAPSLGQWGADSFAPLLERVGNGFMWIGGAVQGMDFADARAGCRDLSSTTDDLEALIPTPSPTVDSHLEVAAQNLKQFTRGCQGINVNTSSAKLDEWAEHRDTAGTALQSAADEVEVAQGQATSHGKDVGGNRDRAILHLEAKWWATAGGKEQAIRDQLAMTPVRYYRRLNDLIDTEAALTAYPLAINRLRGGRSEKHLVNKSFTKPVMSTED